MTQSHFALIFADAKKLFRMTQHFFFKAKQTSANMVDCTTKNVFDVYPNPATDILTFQQKKPEYESYIINIYSIYGQLIRQQKVNNSSKFELQIDHLESGMYIYSIFSNDILIESNRFIKQ